MSRDKHKSLSRRLEILEEAIKGCVFFHREGGYAMADPDIQRLIKDGHLVFKRAQSNGKPLSPKRFVGNFRRDYNQINEHAPDEREPNPIGCAQLNAPQLGGHLHGHVNVTRGLVTDTGSAFYEQNATKT